MKKFEVGKPITEDDLLTFELPPVSEKESGFIEAEPEPKPEQPDVTIGQGVEQSDDRLTSESPSTPSGAEAHRGRLSDSGEPYDPDVHSYPPSQTAKTKRWRKKSRRQMEQEKTERKASGEPDIDYGAEIRKSAENVAFAYGNGHQFIYGEGGTIENNEDLLPLITALERYMQQNGAKDIPPGLSVVMNAGFYTARVAQRETNKEKTAAIMNKVKGGAIWLLVKMRIMKPRKKEQPEPLVSGGDAKQPVDDTPIKKGSDLNKPLVAGG